MKRKKTILIVLVILFAITLIYRILNPFKQERVDRLTFNGNPTHMKIKKNGAHTRLKGTSAKHDIMLDLFLNPPGHSGNMHKDIFFKQKTVRKEKARKQESHLAESVEIQTHARIDQELKSFKVFGSYKKGDEKIIFFERGKDILVVRKGDRLGRKYLVEKITNQAVTLSAETIEEEIHIDLGEL